MIKREQIIQSIYNVIEDIAVANQFVLVRNKEFNYEMQEPKLVVLRDGKSEVVDTVFSPRIETIELSIEIELYIVETEGDLNMQMASFEENIRDALKNYDISTTAIQELSLTPSETEIEEPQNGTPIKTSFFNVVVVFDD